MCDYRHNCSGSRARAVAYTGHLQAGDPGCSYNWHEWKELTHHEEWSEPEHGERSPGYDNGSKGPRHERMSILEVSWAAREETSPWLLGCGCGSACCDLRDFAREHVIASKDP